MENKFEEIKQFLDEEGRLVSLPSKHKKKLVALYYLAEKIAADREYSEPEINDLLDGWAVFGDHATLRRELYNKRLLDRKEDCSRYWKEKSVPPLDEFVKSRV